MGKASKIVKCVDCGREFPRKELNRKLRCQECRIKVVRDNTLQLMRHEGPHYEKWKARIKEAARRL